MSINYHNLNKNEHTHIYRQIHLHVTLLDVFIGVFIDAILFPAFSVEPEEAAHRHPCLVVLMQEPARVTLHAQAAQPVPAHRLPEAPPPGDVAAAHGVHRGRGGSGGASVRHRGGGRGGVVRDEGAGGGGGGGGGGGVEAALEIEAEDSLGILHWNWSVDLKRIRDLKGKYEYDAFEV